MSIRNYTLLLFMMVVVDVGLAAIISTANCNFVRRSYDVTLQLVYAYKIQFASGSENQLEGTEIAIANAVAQALDTCDDMDRPLFAVKTGAKHIFTGQDESAVADGKPNTYFATGTTEILLDYFSAQAREEAYAAIRIAFKNATIIKIFDQTVVQTEYIHAINEALVFPEEDTASGDREELTVVIAIATGIVAFLVAALLCFGLMHERKKTKAHYNTSHGFDKFESISSSRSQKSDHMSSNRSFSRLTDDFSSKEYSMIEEKYHDQHNYLPSTIWSVSDITSDDSGSIRSFLSRATTKLESIEEGEENEEMMEMNRRRHKRRTLKEYDCFQFKTGSVYISNLAQCQNSLTMPKTEDLEVGMPQDLQILVDGTNQLSADAVPKVQHSSSHGNAAIPASTCSVKKDLGQVKGDFEKSKIQEIIPTAPMISTNTEDSEEHASECESIKNATEKSKLPDNGGDGEEIVASSSEVESNDSADEKDDIRSVIDNDSVARDSTPSNSSIEDSAHFNHERSVNIMIDRQDDLQIDTSVAVSPEVGITPVTSNIAGPECMIDTGSPSILLSNDSEIRSAEALALCVQPFEASQLQDSSVRYDEANYELDRENTSLYSLDMDETIVTIIDDIIAAIDDSKLLDTTAEQSKASGNNETILDDIQTEKSDDSFFVDDDSASDIEDSGREISTEVPSSSISQPRRGFVLSDVTNSFMLNELKKKRVATDESSDTNTTYTL
ncbi:unnamed protein product [Cylindrotheca closterium]|uniref:Uncharacterized protein n=1 Tax=Cylindrotheca closterium TaxID=2856 RepID=A0AAD2FUF4_9STRA|nr:unnamed protein product [Cylindrotheca closterium]